MEDGLIVSLGLLLTLFITGLILARTEKDTRYILLSSGVCLVAAALMIADTNALLTKEAIAVTLLAAMVGAGALRAKANKNCAILWVTGFAASILMFVWLAESLGFLTGFLEIVCTIILIGCGAKLTSELEMSEK
jgi:apolipoprotein N-acyltransferase